MVESVVLHAACCTPSFFAMVDPAYDDRLFEVQLPTLQQHELANVHRWRRAFGASDRCSGRSDEAASGHVWGRGSGDVGIASGLSVLIKDGKSHH